MQLLSVFCLLILATPTAKYWNIKIYSDTTCKNYISSWSVGGDPWTFGYNYDIHCAKVTNGPDGGSYQFWSDDGCPKELGNFVITE
ncbi:uncharacterized protein N7473_006549 [Penicillium subrubescens]|jgi:hypothetical protein|uniref:uncharacterized protein n=1 Tax=Penicillium subrubescens TaxID=1316194 RepID=UPI002544F943|nr:uncharacterized protein N7473_006549 [Penicillium subrubescens]KAJ5890321.1 hypothetical protein N7473_006549 [Penicillium subrubescens]